MVRRSIVSRVVEDVIKGYQGMQKFDTDESAEKFIQKNIKEALEPYTIPPVIMLSYLDQYSLDGMECFQVSPRRMRGGKHILYLHGGGYLMRPTSLHWSFFDMLARETRQSITIPLYPQLPNHTYKDTYPKVLEIYNELLKLYYPQNITIMGDSAGGGLTLGFCEFLAKKKLPQPGNAVLLSPWLDAYVENPLADVVAERDPLMMLNVQRRLGKMWAFDGNPNYYRASPLRGNLRGLPPLTVFAGNADVLTPDCRVLAEKARRSGVPIDYYEYADMSHDFVLYNLPESKKAVDIIIEKIK